MDPIDEQILTLLADDARRAYEDIGRQVNLSPSAVKRRIDALRASGVLRGFTAVIDYEARGWTIEALIQLYLRGDALQRKREWIASLQEVPEIVEAWLVAGDWDAVAHVIAKDGESFERLLLALRGNGLVERTNTVMVLSQLVEHRIVPMHLPADP